MKCNACHRDASFAAKFSFCQLRKPGEVLNAPRFTISFETEGGYCTDCELRMSRMARDNNFTEIIGADVRQEVEIIFKLRGWGGVSWPDTVVEFKRLKEPDNNLTLPLDQIGSN
jgi:hypothetical protein